MSIEELSRSIMGVDEFQLLAQYFVSLFVLAARRKKEGKPFFVVFITRRCYVLFWIFVKIFNECDDQDGLAWERLRGLYSEAIALDLKWEDCCNLLRDHFITDINLLSLCHHMTQYYAKMREFPALIICDELLIHGRMINSFLNELEENLLKHLQQIEAEEREILQLRLGTKLVQALQLYVYARNDDVMLLLPRYYSALKVFRERMEKNQWRALSMYFSRLVSVAPVNNVAYAWSFSEELSDRFEEFPCPDKVFERCDTEIYEGFKQTTFVFVHLNKNNTKAICTVRTKESLTKYQNHPYRMYVPYILYNRVNFDNVVKLHFTLCEDIQNDVLLRGDQKEIILSFLTRRGVIETPADIYAKQISYRWLAQTNELLLSCLLMREYLLKSHYSSCAASEWMSEKLDLDQIAHNYARVDDAELKTNLNETVAALKAILYWAPHSDALRCYLDLLTEDALPLWEGDIFSSGTPKHKDFSKDTFAADAVLDAIAKLGLDVEKNAYEYGCANVFFDESAFRTWNRPYSMRDLLYNCKNQFESPLRMGDSTADLTQVTALIVQAMDLGLIGMTVMSSDDKQHNVDNIKEVYTQVKAGEQALFIHPIRYAEMNMALQIIEEKCHSLQGLWDLEVFLFAKAVQKSLPSQGIQNLDKRLIKYMEELRSTGQTLSEWDLVSQKSSIEVQINETKRIRALLNRLKYEGIYRTM